MLRTQQRASERAQIITPISASANPGGPVDTAAYDAICDAIGDAASVCDAVMLDLHDAMVAENSNDGAAACAHVHTAQYHRPRRHETPGRRGVRDGMLAVSVPAGFSFADVVVPCISVVVVGNGDREAAARVAERIARHIWEACDEFFYRSAPPAKSVAKGAALGCHADKPVLLLDHGDNCMSGGTCDTTEALQEAAPRWTKVSRRGW